MLKNGDWMAAKKRKNRKKKKIRLPSMSPHPLVDGAWRGRRRIACSSRWAKG